MTPPAAAEELRRAVEEAATGTPYVVTPTEHGFDVSLDIVDAQWFGLFGLRLRRGVAEKVGIAFAVVAVGGLLVAGVAVGILALLGKL